MTVEQYLRPRSVAETLAMLAEYGEDAKLIAGGQSLMVLLHEGLIHPRALISLSGVTELSGVSANGQARIGALASHTQVLTEPAIAARWPVLATAERAVSSVQIRNRGTLCGNLAHAYPTADPPAALLVLDADVVISSRRGERAVPVADFITGPLTTILAPDELITAVTLPPPPPDARYAYLKYAIRPLDFAILGVAVRVVLGGDGRLRQVRIGLNGAADRPLRATAAEQLLEGAPHGTAGTTELAASAAEAAADQSDPLGEVFESSAYRRDMVRVYVRRALEKALGGRMS